MNTKKILSLICIALLVITMSLFFAGVLSGWWFWVAIVVCALFAYKVLPRMKNDHL